MVMLIRMCIFRQSEAPTYLSGKRREENWWGGRLGTVCWARIGGVIAVESESKSVTNLLATQYPWAAFLQVWLPLRFMRAWNITPSSRGCHQFPCRLYPENCLLRGQPRCRSLRLQPQREGHATLDDFACAKISNEREETVFFQDEKMEKTWSGLCFFGHCVVINFA